MDEYFTKVFNKELDLDELHKIIIKSDSNQCNITIDELRLQYLESKFPIIRNKEPSNEEYDEYFVVTHVGTYLLYPSQEENNMLVPKPIVYKGVKYPIKVQEITPEYVSKYIITDGNDGEILLYHKNISILEKTDEPTELEKDTHFIGTTNITYKLYPRVKLWSNQIIPMQRMVEILSSNDISVNVSEQGLGKTLMTIYVIQELGLDFYVLIACPPGPAETMWRRELKAHGINVLDVYSYRILGGTWGKRYKPIKILRRTERLTEGLNKKVDFEVTPYLKDIIRSKDKPLLVICDEVHNIKDQNNKAPHAIRAIVKTISENDENYSRCIYLSGTPIDNIKKQSINYLHIMGIMNTVHLYQKRGGFIEMTGAKQIIEMCERLDRQAGTNYTQETIQKEFTNKNTGQFDKQWKTKPIKIKMIPELMLEHVISKHLFVAAIKKKVDYIEDTAIFYLDVDSEDVKNRLEKNVKEIEILSSYNSDTQEAQEPWGQNMVKLTELIMERQAIKASILGEYLKKRLHTIPNIKVIIALDYNDPQTILEKILEEFSPIIYDGKTKDKTASINKFNTDPNCRVWIGKTKSMSECINIQDTVGNSPRELYVLVNLSAQNTDQVIKRHDRGNSKSIPKTRLVFVENQKTELYILASLGRKYRDMRSMLPEEARITRMDIRNLPEIFQRAE